MVRAARWPRAGVDLEAQTISLLHCGDARGVVVGLDKPAAAFETSDHTLKLASERAALENRGGSSRGGRVLADQWAVAVPRALGGKVWRAAGISPAPDVATLPCGGADGLALASDGLWDVLSSDDAAAFVRGEPPFRPSVRGAGRGGLARAAALGSTDRRCRVRLRVRAQVAPCCRCYRAALVGVLGGRHRDHAGAGRFFHNSVPPSASAKWIISINLSRDFRRRP